METAPITFVHMTDLHVNAPGADDPHLLTDTTATLKRTLGAIKAMNPAPDFIVASGDLTNHGDAEAYRALRALLEAAAPEVPILLALGNHDKRAGFCEVFGDLHADADLPFDHARVVAGIHVIVLDSSISGSIGGAWEPGQMDWLAARLAEHPELPRLLVMHHAPMLDLEDIVMEWQSLSAQATRELRAALGGHDVAGILSGHVHLDRVSHWHGIPVVIGMGHHAGTDPLDLRTGMGMTDGSGFAIGTLRHSGLTVTYAPHPASREVLFRLDYEVFLQYIAKVAADRAAAEAAE